MTQLPRPTVVCMTPVKNEAWILEHFLKCASEWADHIIIADQGSDDGSQEIARSFPKVRLIENTSKTFNEPERQKMLIKAAREIPGQKLLIALDADEFFPANFTSTAEWELSLRATPGTVIGYLWACVLPDKKTYYDFPGEFPLGFMDDGSEHHGDVIHSPRVPIPEGAPRISLRTMRLLHLSTIDGERFASKVRWYQTWEFLKGRWDGKLIELYRQYHKDFHIPDNKVLPLPAEWTDELPSNILDISSQPFYRWDEEMIRLFREHGEAKFRKLNVWEPDWNALREKMEGPEGGAPVVDPRSGLDRWIHSWLCRTQPRYSHFSASMSRCERLWDRILCKLLPFLGW